MYNPSRQTANTWTIAKKNKRFAELYVIECGYNASAAYRKLWQELNPDGDVTKLKDANRTAYEYRHKDAVKKEISKIEEQIRESQEVRRNEVVFNLRNIAFNDENPTNERLKAMDLLNKMGGFYTENYKVDTNATIEVTLED